MHSWSDREFGEIVGSLLVAIHLGEKLLFLSFRPLAI